jgi:hypothetical protein
MARLFKTGITSEGDITAGNNLRSSYSAGDEGGQIFLNKPVNNTNIVSGVNIDIYQNKLRFWEDGGTNRGFYIDLTTGGTSVGTNLVSGGGGSGTVTSVAMTVPTGLSISGSPITTSGTLDLTLTSGYSIPTTASQTNWDTAYGWGNHSSAGYLTTSSASSTYLTQTNAGTTYQPKFVQSTTAPSSPASGWVWYKTDTGQTFTYSDSYWVESGTSSIVDTSSIFYSAGGKNIIINGAFDFWQRGTSQTATGVASADRWYNLVSGTTTVSQETSDLPTGFQNGIKLVTAGSSSFAQFKQYIERAAVIPLRGQQMTVSGWVKIAGSYSGNWVIQMYYSSSSDANGSVTTQVGSNVVIGTSATTSWTRFSGTFTVPSDAVGLGVFFIPDVAQPSGVTVRMTGIQLESGPTATQFSRAGGTVQGELAACQRFYFRGGNSAAGVFSSATLGRFSVFFPTEMRSAPSIAAIAAPQALNPTVAESQTGSQTTSFSATASGGLVTTKAASKIQFGGFTSAADGRPSVLLNDCLEFSAEL